MRAPLVIAVVPLKVLSDICVFTVRLPGDCSRSTEGALSDLCVHCAPHFVIAVVPLKVLSQI